MFETDKQRLADTEIERKIQRERHGPGQTERPTDIQTETHKNIDRNAPAHI